MAFRCVKYLRNGSNRGNIAISSVERCQISRFREEFSSIIRFVCVCGTVCKCAWHVFSCRQRSEGKIVNQISMKFTFRCECFTFHNRRLLHGSVRGRHSSIPSQFLALLSIFGWVKTLLFFSYGDFLQSLRNSHDLLVRLINTSGVEQIGIAFKWFMCVNGMSDRRPWPERRIPKWPTCRFSANLSEILPQRYSKTAKRHDSLNSEHICHSRDEIMENQLRANNSRKFPPTFSTSHSTDCILINFPFDWRNWREFNGFVYASPIPINKSQFSLISDSRECFL